MSLSLVRRRATSPCLLVLCALVSSTSSLGGGQAPSSVPAETDRLIAVAKTWATVKYLHPYLSDHPIDWDKALLDALPRIRSSQDNSEYKTAVGAMLSVLQDPLTRVLSRDDKLELPPGITPQRTRIHHGLPPYTNGWRGFYSGVVERSAAPVSTMSLPLGSGLTASIRLSEPIAQGRRAESFDLRDRTIGECFSFSGTAPAGCIPVVGRSSLLLRLQGSDG